MAQLRLETFRIKGFKSIKDQTLEFRPVNVLIGANGSGKSNLISAFSFLRALVEERLQVTVAQAGGADRLLYYGRKQTNELEFEVWFSRNDSNRNGYFCKLVPGEEDVLFLTTEQLYYWKRDEYKHPLAVFLSDSVKTESSLPGELASTTRKGIPGHVLEALRSWRVYHFHDTSEGAKVKQSCDLDDNAFLRPDAGNLAAYLYWMKERRPAEYRKIIEVVRLAAPFFGDFFLEPSPLNPSLIQLRWTERRADMIFPANALSDGTLRFVCLATLFLQPEDKLPSVVILDEPELGLHPFAIGLLAEMVHSVQHKTQVLLATQSVTLINHFGPEEVVVADRKDGETIFKRLEADQLKHWLAEYTLGELWEKNVLGGRPTL